MLGEPSEKIHGVSFFQDFGDNHVKSSLLNQSNVIHQNHTFSSMSSTTRTRCLRSYNVSAAETLRLLADSTRLRILNLLLEEELSVAELQEILDLQLRKETA